MNTRRSGEIPLMPYYSFPFLFLLMVSVFRFNASAQHQQPAESEMAVCKVTVNDKDYTVKPNQIGSFERIRNISPSQVVPVEIFYPAGKPGDKVVVSVQDGGKLDSSKTVRMIRLNNDKKISFSFQVTNQPGLYRILLIKGNDTKMVRLWVGPDPSSN